MHYSNLLKGTAVALSLAAGCAFASSAASAQGVGLTPYATPYAGPYTPYPDYYAGPYGYQDEYAPGPLTLGADIVGDAVDVGLTAATIPFWGGGYDDGNRAYPAAYGYGYGYDDEGPGYGYARPVYDGYHHRHPTVQQQVRAAHHMNHHHYRAE